MPRVKLLLWLTLHKLLLWLTLHIRVTTVAVLPGLEFIQRVPHAVPDCACLGWALCGLIDLSVLP